MQSLSRDNRLLWVALFLWGIGEGLFAYQIPLYLKALGADPVAIGSALSLALAVTAFTHIPAGLVSDRLGHRRVFIAAFGLCVVTTLAMFLAPSLALFVPALVVYYFTGFSSVPINAYMAQARGAQSMQRAITLVWTGYWCSTLFSPFLGGQISRAVGLRPLFGIGTVLFVISWLLMLLLREQRVTVPTAGRSHPRQLLRNRRYVGYVALVGLSLTAMYLALPLAPNFIAEVRGHDTGVVGLLGSANAAGALLLNLVLGQRAPRRAFMLAQAFMAVSVLIMFTLSAVPWLMLAFALRASWFLAHNMAMAQVGRVVNSDELGLALGIMETLIGLLLASAPFLAGLLYERSPFLPFQISLLLIGLCLALFWRFAPRRDSAPETVPAVVSGEVQP